MLNTSSNFVKVANLDELAEGKPRAIRVEGQSIALFKHNGNIYATDNQCPHMGYPLTRGRVRGGVLTCDWHGWSYDMGGGAVSQAVAMTYRPSQSKYVKKRYTLMSPAAETSGMTPIFSCSKKGC